MMKPENEKKVLTTLYDRIFDAITYSPEGKPGVFSKDTTYFQMDKNHVIDPKDFENMYNPSEPNGDMRAMELFSNMVDVLPFPGSLWNDSGKKVSETYELIVGGANSSHQTDPEQQKNIR